MRSARSQLGDLVKIAKGFVGSRRWKRANGPLLLALTYHRILPLDHPAWGYDEPGMLLSPDTLAMHVEMLRSEFEVLHLEDWQARRQQGLDLPRLACALTFDDGWRDNLTYALPVLRRTKTPATIFVVTAMVGSNDAFWPHRLSRYLRTAEFFVKELTNWPDKVAPFALPLSVRLRAQGRNPDADEVDEIIHLCKLHSDAEMHEWVHAHFDSASMSPDLVSWDELREMSRDDTFRVGSHTHTHRRFLPVVPLAIIEHEVVAAKEAIRRELGVEAASFCYPSGDHFPAACEVVGRHHLVAVSTVPGWNRTSEDPMLLRRYYVHENSSRKRALLNHLISGDFA